MPAEAVPVTRVLQLRPDPTRVIAKAFIAGQEDVGPTGTRARLVIERVMALTDDQVDQTLDDVITRFATRHRGLLSLLDHQACLITGTSAGSTSISASRRLLIGAYFTHEYAVEAAALANPSMVPHPVQDVEGAIKFVMSVRGIGEGHRSSIGFRTGSVSVDGRIWVDATGPYAEMGRGTPGTQNRGIFLTRLTELGHDPAQVRALMDALAPTFSEDELRQAAERLGQASTMPLAPTLIRDAMELSRWSYRVSFPDDTEVSERLLWPHAPPEYHGMEDARFTRFTDDDGTVTYLATYTAFDRNDITLQILKTTEFQHFASAPVDGAAALGKGMALFPRRVNGQFAALTRCDRESNGLAMSDDLHHWETTTTFQTANEPWESVQLGNCGPPIELDEGWLVLTHGVGPMRTYSIGALLLDLADPTTVIARSHLPVLTPQPLHRDGYVPNVVYSCGAMRNGDILVLPYGVADQSIEIATLSISALLDAMTPTGG